MMMTNGATNRNHIGESEDDEVVEGAADFGFVLESLLLPLAEVVFIPLEGAFYKISQR